MDNIRKLFQQFMLARGYKPCQRCGKWVKDIYLLCQPCFTHLFDWSEIE